MAQRFDSTPFLHAARRRCISYSACLKYAVAIGKKDAEGLALLAQQLGLSSRDCAEIKDAWRNEQLRRAIALKEG